VAVAGKTIRVSGKPELCHRGLHASVSLDDAQKYQPDGPLLLCESGLHASKHPSDALTMARFLQAIVWRQDQLEASFQKTEVALDDTLRNAKQILAKADVIESSLKEISTLVYSQLRVSP